MHVKSEQNDKGLLKKEKSNNAKTLKPDLSELRKILPPYVARNYPRLRELCNISGRTLANLDNLKPPQGPPKRIMLGNVVAYERESFVDWLEERSKVL